MSLEGNISQHHSLKGILYVCGDISEFMSSCHPPTHTHTHTLTIQWNRISSNWETESVGENREKEYRYSFRLNALHAKSCQHCLLFSWLKEYQQLSLMWTCRK